MIVKSEEIKMKLSFTFIYFAKTIGKRTDIQTSRAVRTRTKISLKNNAINIEIMYIIKPAILINTLFFLFSKSFIFFKISFEKDVIAFRVYESNEEAIAANAAIIPI